MYFKRRLLRRITKTSFRKIDFLFLDVDLVNSTYDCIKYLWKYIVDDSFIFSDDACDIDGINMVRSQMVEENLGCKPPGYIGSGCGIPLGSKYSSLGYTIKNPKKDKYNKAFFYINLILF